MDDAAQQLAGRREPLLALATSFVVSILTRGCLGGVSGRLGAFGPDWRQLRPLNHAVLAETSRGSVLNRDLSVFGSSPGSRCWGCVGALRDGKGMCTGLRAMWLAVGVLRAARILKICFGSSQVSTHRNTHRVMCTAYRPHFSRGYGAACACRPPPSKLLIVRDRADRVLSCAHACVHMFA